MKQPAVFLLLAAILQAGAHAADWAGFADSSSVDLSSIRKTGGYTKAWFRNTYYVQKKTLALTGKQYDTEKYLLYFNCRTREAATIQDHFYLGTEYVSGTVFPVSPQLFSDVIPDSLGETELNIACSKVPKKAIEKMRPTPSSSIDLNAFAKLAGVSSVQPTRPRIKHQPLNPN